MKTLSRVVLAALLFQGVSSLVHADVPPSCVSASGTVNLDVLVVTFSEQMDPGPANDSFNYSVPGYTVGFAALDATGTRVRMQLDAPLTPGGAYTVTIQNLTDVTGNVIVPNPCTLTFEAFVPSC